MGLVRREEHADAMGTTFSIILYGYDKRKMEATVKAAWSEVRRLEAMLSAYRPDSEWSEVNRHASQKAVPISPELFQLLSRCLEYSRLSQGAFDISIGAAMKAWKFFRGSGRLPSPRQAAVAGSKVGYQHLHLDLQTRTVRFTRPGMHIDPGGIGKGYAVDCIVAILKREGFQRALVAGSGSSIYGLGTPPQEPAGWRIDIGDPSNPRKSGVEVFLKNMSLSTSGIFPKQFWTTGRSYTHIIDPRTGCPAQGMLSVSVMAPQALDSEAWTKPCFIKGRQWAMGNNPKGFRFFFFESLTCHSERSEESPPKQEILRCTQDDR